MALRWRKNKRPTGLASVTCGDVGHSLYEGDVRFAVVSASRVNFQTVGWYWVAGWDSDIPHMNTCNDIVADDVTAKNQAMAYVREQLIAMTMAST